MKTATNRETETRYLTNNQVIDSIYYHPGSALYLLAFLSIIALSLAIYQK